MTTAVVDPVVSVDPESGDRTVARAYERGDVILLAARAHMCPPVRSPQIRARCPLHPCPTDSTFIAETEVELIDLLADHYAEVPHREDRPR